MGHGEYTSDKSRGEADNLLYIIVPMFNEAANVPDLIQTLTLIEKQIQSEFKIFVIFVDDCSIDQTVQKLRSRSNTIQSVILKHDKNLGPGAAFATAFEYLHGRLEEDDWIVTMEGDNTSPPETLLHMLIRRKEGYDVVLASPYLYGGGMSNVTFHRLLISHIANGLVKILLGIAGIQTFSCFFRLYSGRIILMLQSVYGRRIIACPGFECMVELLAKLINIKARISEVEMSLDWAVRKGTTKMNIPKTALGYLRLFTNRNQILRKY